MVAAPPPACTSAQIHIAARHIGAAAGTSGGYLSFRNISKVACRISGWPTVVAIRADGRAVPAVRQRSTMFGPTLHTKALPVIVLQPGRRAEAVFTVSDVPPGQGRSPCPAYHSLRVEVPGGTRTVALSAWFESLGFWLPACGPMWISPVVPAADLFKG